MMSKASREETFPSNKQAQWSADMRLNMLRYRGFCNETKRAARSAMLLAGIVFALPISCGQASDGVYTGGIQPSPAGRVNPADPGFTNGAPYR